MYGRPEDWQPGLVDETVEPARSRASPRPGFDGIARRPLRLSRQRAERSRRRSAKVAATEPIASPDGRFSFFDLRPYGEELAAR